MVTLLVSLTLCMHLNLIIRLYKTVLTQLTEVLPSTKITLVSTFKAEQCRRKEL